MFLVELFERRASLRDGDKLGVLDSALLREVGERAAELDDLFVESDVGIEARDEQLCDRATLRRVADALQCGFEELDAVRAFLIASVVDLFPCFLGDVVNGLVFRG